MKNPVKIEIRQTDGNEVDVKTIDLIKTLYSVWLTDKEVSTLNFCVFIVCDSLLTKEEKEEIEKAVFGMTLDESEEKEMKKK